ncbi:WbqC family protein [Aeromicrobium wangtongii]|uniref:WbqC family protein n=1 Tax=Aeromicrobium wangtongii TaxID=2969247 RepID=A0ABY5MBT4_9ACTN|nr:WbqC family protein [Aeromicrobium wangtongii]MCD9196876.1 WbqC family protein [Aeromicrobium wangtongii]UUP14384.1 WbqC family protein [Aeromicrobium wangtongii]
MIITGHQADLLPRSEFWYKMAKADLFDLRIYDPLEARGFQRRVMMRGRWASIPIIAGPPGSLISEARIIPEETREALRAVVTERYRDAKHWSRHGPTILAMIDDIHTEHLWQLNLQLILGVREVLGIRTPVSIAPPPAGTGVTDLISVMHQYNATSYLSGTEGRAYVDDDESYRDSGVQITWSTHRPVTGDSILSVLMDYDDPMSVVMAEEPWLVHASPAGPVGSRRRV